MKKFITLISILALQFASIAQVPGTWTEYFSFQNVTQLETVDDNIFALSNNGIFVYNRNTKEITKITKLNGLSSVGLTCMAFCDYTSSFLVGYSDGTLNIIDYPSLNIQSIKTITQKNIYGSKQINQICMHNDTAFIATEFGIISFSLHNKTFIATTILSNDGDYLPVKSISASSSMIYAATTKGIYSANIAASNLSDFSTWNKLSGIPYENDTIRYIAANGGNIYYAHCNTLDNSKDSVFVITNGTATAFKTQIPNLSGISSRNNILGLTAKFVAKVYDSSQKLLFSYDSTNVVNSYTDIVIANDGSQWVGDANYGLISCEHSKVIVPQGPNSNHIADLFYENKNLHVVSGRISLWESLLYSVKTLGGGWYGTSDWRIGNSQCIYVMPNTSTYYIGTYGFGFTQSEHSWVIDTVYNLTNSTLLQPYHTNGTETTISDITSDKYGNLWIINQSSNTPIIAIDKENTWHPFSIAPISGSNYDLKNLYNNMFIDNNGYKWLTGTSYLSVFNDNKTLDDSSDDQFVRIPLSDAEGTIASRSTCVTEDLTGEIWVGTTQGIAVHSSPSRVFKDRKTISRIKIEIDGEVGYLLSSETINCIAVDGGNRKWIGTANSGIFLLSENGTEQLLNFTKSNSPLPSNCITSIAIDNETGEVYIGTEEGLVSYIGNATAGDTQMNDAYIFPNPVRDTYNGNIFIKGLVANALIKITDVSGNLVNNVEANGGTAEWNGKNIYGERVSTGVYLLYISDENGENTKVMKLLFIH
jgi:hypothetical protein